MKRFWDKVDKSGDCWEWQGATASGYGRIYFNGKYDGAHRVSLLLSGVDIPSGMCVLHTCDNKLCVNPDHLRIGSQSDNIKDMYEKGRQSFENKAVGERHGRSKLTEDSVRHIRRLDGFLHRDSIAKIFNISTPTVSEIINRRKWRHVA